MVRSDNLTFKDGDRGAISEEEDRMVWETRNK